MATTAMSRTSSSDIHEPNPTTKTADEKLVDAHRPEKSLVSESYHLQLGDEDPTDDELSGPGALRRVSAPIPWAVYTVAFVELCERFSYYGSAVLYTNFVNKPLPPGSTTGAPLTTEEVPGALGMGQKAAQGISLFNQFFAYLMPLFG